LRKQTVCILKEGMLSLSHAATVHSGKRREGSVCCGWPEGEV
jgi:hypothetical protein